MKSKNTHHPLSLRFRRWSRAGYAVFCSLGRTVTIGSLAVSISDKSLQKSVGVSKCSELNFASDTESSSVESTESEELDLILNPQLSNPLNQWSWKLCCVRSGNCHF